MSNAEVSMISLQEESMKKRSKIDFSKLQFTDNEKFIIRKEVELVREKYPNYIPIVVRCKNNSINISKKKYLVGGEITIGQFLFILRKKLTNVNSSEALYLFVNNTLPSSNTNLSVIYNEKRDLETEMLFVTICKENTFGN
jgi:GABA(A) receptor-associated protein